MNLMEERIQVRHEIAALGVKLKNLKSESNKVKEQYRYGTGDLIRQIEELEKSTSSMKGVREGLQDRIASIIDLNSAFDVSNDRLNDSDLCVYQKEVATKKLEILIINEDIEKISQKVEILTAETHADKQNANDALDILKEKISTAENELKEKVEYEKKLSRVINPNAKPKRVEESLEGNLSNPNSTFNIVAHIAFGLLTIPIFGPVGTMAAAFNFWRLVRKWKKHQKDNDYKKSL
ncbi:hypothetical protein [Shewanella frigidimarina]|uniref:hypothetical protein n=1 Tax=Shewanella frigidimarina TaxID=56812 RepID=UPI003D78EB3C